MKISNTFTPESLDTCCQSYVGGNDSMQGSCIEIVETTNEEFIWQD